MKTKLIALHIALMSLFANYGTAQNLMIDNFESGQVSFTSTVNINPEPSGRFEVVDNLNKTEINPSGKVWKYTRLTVGEEWAGFWSMLSKPFHTAGYKYLHIKYYRTNAHSQLRVLMEGNGFKKEFGPLNGYNSTQTNVWENLVYDLDANGLSNSAITVFGFQPDFSSNRSENTVVYIDDIQLTTNIAGDGGFSSFLPKDLTVRDVQPSSLDLSWSAVKEAISYDIYVDDLFRQNTNSTSLSIEGLQEFEVYKLHIKAKNAEGDVSLPSDAVYVQTAETKVARDTRMAWWREARFGMFIHWGGYSSYAGSFHGYNVKGEWIEYDSKGSGNGSYAEWLMFGARIPRDTYRAKVAEAFTAANYKPVEWVRMAKEAGMKYIIITSKHHEGLSLFNTKVGWNAIEHSPASADLMRDLVDEARKEGLKIGFYYSQALDWNNEGGLGWMPQNNNGDGGEWPLEKKTEYVDKVVIPHINTLVNDYNIDVIWFDLGEPKHPELQYKTLKAIKDNPRAANIIFNDRLEFKINNGFSGDFGTPEQSIPDIPITGRADGRDWETCMTMNENWGYCAKDNNWKSTKDMLLKLIDIASKGGNYLLNIGPKADGTFPQQSIDRLIEVGDWMKVNGEAIYGTIANPFSKPFDWGKVTRKIDGEGNTILYLHVSQWSSNGELNIPFLASLPKEVSLLGNSSVLTAELKAGVVLKGLPFEALNSISSTIKMVFEGDVLIEENTVFPDETGEITLFSDDSKVYEGLCVEGDPGMRNIGCWASAGLGLVNGKVQWNIRVDQDALYEVSAHLHSTEATQFNIRLNNGEAYNFVCPQNNGYQIQSLGDLSLSKGTYSIELTRTATTANWSYVNLLSLSLIPKTATEITKPDTLEGAKVYTLSNELYIEGLEVGSSIRLYSVLGETIYSQTSTKSVERFDMRNNAVVILQIEKANGTGKIIQKIVR